MLALGANITRADSPPLCRLNDAALPCVCVGTFYCWNLAQMEAFDDTLVFPHHDTTVNIPLFGIENDKIENSTPPNSFPSNPHLGVRSPTTGSEFHYTSTVLNLTGGRALLAQRMQAFAPPLPPPQSNSKVQRERYKCSLLSLGSRLCFYGSKCGLVR